MKHYEALITEESRRSLGELNQGVVGMGLAPIEKYPSDCYFALPAGGFIHISCEAHDLEWKFEVFSIVAERVSSCPCQIMPSQNWSQKNEIFLLRTEEWLDSEEVAGRFWGQHPVVQRRNKPGTILESASAQCIVDVGIALVNNQGHSFIIAASIFPLALYVTGCSTEEEFDEAQCEWMLL
ncbi:MAG: hypothetical protein ACYDCO_09900 [Armatimonadota bacterium]